MDADLKSPCELVSRLLPAAATRPGRTSPRRSGQIIARARDKAAARSLPTRFQVADVLSLARLGMTFEVVIDSGVFHVFGDEDRTAG